MLLSVLVFLHWLFASFWGNFSRSLILAIAFVFVLGSLEPIWIQQLSKPLRPDALAALTWASIVVNRGFAILLAGLTDHEDILPVEREHLIRVSLDVFG